MQVGLDLLITGGLHHEVRHVLDDEGEGFGVLAVLELDGIAGRGLLGFDLFLFFCLRG